jgi:uncharacterized membrane protein YqaE (UPF0057 family)
MILLAFAALLADAVNNLSMWSLIVGFFLPLAISFPVQHHWSDSVRAVFAFCACVVAAVGTVLIQQGGWNWANWVTSLLTILVTSIATYKGLWTKVMPQTHNGGGGNP